MELQLIYRCTQNTHLGANKSPKRPFPVFFRVTLPVHPCVATSISDAIYRIPGTAVCRRHATVAGASLLSAVRRSSADQSIDFRWRTRGCGVDAAREAFLCERRRRQERRGRAAGASSGSGVAAVMCVGVSPLPPAG